jgi:glycosyltransferase involved in cell wall biosynthesis
MRIAFVTNPWAFQLPGGGEQVLIQSRDALVARGHDVTLFDPWTHKFTDFDLVHYFHCPGWDSWTRIKASGRPLVVTPTLWYEPAGGGWLLRQMRHAAHRLVDRWWSPPIDERTVHHHLMIPDLLLPASAGEAERLHRHAAIPRARMHVVRNAVSVSGSDTDMPQALADALAAAGQVLCVGSFHRHKNQLALIRALRGTALRVVFIGGRYPDDAGYLDRCRSEAGDRHVFFPEQPRPVVLAAMRRARLYAQPSFSETCGLAALEAAALGCRVAITNRGATREYFGRHAWYFDPDDEAGIRNALLVASEARVNGALSKHVRRAHSPEQLGEALETAYRSFSSAS